MQGDTAPVPSGIQLRLEQAAHSSADRQEPALLAASDINHFALLVVSVVSTLSPADKGRVLNRALQLLDGP